MNESALKNLQKLFGADAGGLKATDPEFDEYFGNFALDEVRNHKTLDGRALDDRTVLMTTLSVLIGCQGIDAYKAILPAALKNGVTPVEAKEIVYQAVDYCGLGRVLPFLDATNDALKAAGVELPLAPQSTTTPETRLQAGIDKQVTLFGERMRDFTTRGTEDRRSINVFLAGNCFGDVYTRGGLTDAEREMCTFCYLYAQGGCQSQATSHAVANLRCGNDRQFLIEVVLQNVPYLGYPRSLNGLAAIDEATERFAGMAATESFAKAEKKAKAAHEKAAKDEEHDKKGKKGKKAKKGKR